MAVYVDPIINYGWKLGPSCHMTADTVEELNKMADRIGMRRQWIQLSQRGITHYDLIESRRKLAVKFGAIELTMQQAAEKYEEFLKP